MKWSRVKWLLILCLVVADCLLCLQLIGRYKSEYTVSGDAIRDLTDILSASGIAVAEGAIPTAADKDYVFRLDYGEDGYREAVAAMVGASVSGTYLLPTASGTSLVFENGDYVEYYHNFYLTYQCGNVENVSYIAEAFHDAPETFQRATGGGARAAGERAVAFLSAMTEDRGSGGARLRPQIEGIYATESDSLYLVYLTEEISRGAASRAAELAGTGVCVLLEEDRVWYLAGTWLPAIPGEVFRTAKQSQLDILFSEKLRLDQLEEETGRPTDCTVKAVTRAYYMLWGEENRLYLRPAWRILYEDNGTGEAQEILCDAVSGDAVRGTEVALVSP